jgi:hydrogenase maturation protease
MKKLSILLLGIGQSLRSDDGVGIAAVRQWRETYPKHASRITVDTVEVPGVGLLPLVQEYQVAVIVDAVQSGADQGTIHIVRSDQISSFTPGSQSAHGWGLAETIRLGQKLYDEKNFPQIYLLGMEINEIELGDRLSTPIQNALPKLVEVIHKEIGRLIRDFEKD